MNTVVVGKIGAPYGVRGWVKVHSYTDPIDNLFGYSLLLESPKGNWQPIKVEQFKAHGDGFVAKLAMIDDRDQAALITNAQIAVMRDALPELEEDEHYWADLHGLAVYNQEDVHLGLVVDVFATGANDVIVVQGTKEYLIPYALGSFVLEVDLEQKIMRVDWDAEF